jgi:hypothetical protein
VLPQRVPYTEARAAAARAGVSGAAAVCFTHGCVTLYVLHAHVLW